MTEFAVQTSNEPTNKLQTGTTVSAGIAAVIAGVFAAYGGEAIREVWSGAMPASMQGPALVGFVVALTTGVATYLASKYGGQNAAYNVLDKPNVPVSSSAGRVP